MKPSRAPALLPFFLVLTTSAPLAGLAHAAAASPATATRDPIAALRGIRGLGAVAASAPDRLPSSAGAEVRVGEGGAWIAVRALDVRDAEGERREGLLAFADVAADTDAVWVPQAAGFEEWRVLRSPRAPIALRHAIRVGPDVADVRVRGRRVEALSRAGEVLLATAPLVAYDVDGRALRVEASVTAQAGPGRFELTTRLDPAEVASARFPIAIDPAWSTAFGFGVGRSDVCIAVTPDGRVQVVGGDDGAGHPGGYSETYDLATGAVTESGSGVGGTEACTQLADGRVMISGGFAGLGDSNSTKVYDYKTGWASLAITLARSNGSALAQYATDKVLMLGAFDSGDQVAEVYTFSSNTWVATANLLQPRRGATALSLADGTVLVVGGTSTASAAAERYYPASSSFKATLGTMVASHTNGLTATMLKTGKVLVIGNSTAAELYDPATDKFTAGGTLSYARSFHTAVLLADGRVLVAGGSGNNVTEIYDPATSKFSFAGYAGVARSHAGGARLLDGRVVVGGGVVGGLNDNTVEFWGNLTGTYCKADYECVSGHCTDGVCCGVAACASGMSCGVPPKLGVCSKTLGSTCAGDGECASGHCADGVCCGTTCTGLCASCALPGKAGTCSALIGQPAAGHGSCGGAGAGTECGPACNGTSTTACALPSSSKACGAPSCASGVATAVGACNGTGTCVSASAGCGAYSCDSTATTCRTSCTAQVDCAPGYACNAGTCVTPVGLGSPCSDASSCATGFCTDGVCCGVDSCGADASCAVGAVAGVCSKKLGVACKIDSECAKGGDGAGHCVDGVCCDTGCSGQCQACDAEGHVGVCTGVNGAPHGTRAACDDGGADVCKARTCQGAVDPTVCTAFANGTAKSCGAAHCDASGKAVAQSFCDGAGTCATPAGSSCDPYLCTDGKGCGSTCATSAECVSGDICRAGRCQAGGAECSSDGLSSVGADGSAKDCAPFRCVAATGACGESCASSDDCSLGASCDTTAGTCSAPTQTTAPSGGCAITPHEEGPRGLGGFAWLAAAAFGLHVHRRRRARRCAEITSVTSASNVAASSEVAR